VDVFAAERTFLGDDETTHVFYPIGQIVLHCGKRPTTTSFRDCHKKTPGIAFLRCPELRQIVSF
jgi:hypothetical protein